MIKPKILSDGKILVSMGTNSVDCLDCGMYIGKFRQAVQVQNDYCYKEMLRQFRELIDKYMANGRYKAPWDDVMVNCLSGDVEYIWEQLKQSLQGLEG